MDEVMLNDECLVSLLVEFIDCMYCGEKFVVEKICEENFDLVEELCGLWGVVMLVDWVGSSLDVDKIVEGFFL